MPYYMGYAKAPIPSRPPLFAEDTHFTTLPILLGTRILRHVVFRFGRDETFPSLSGMVDRSYDLWEFRFLIHMGQADLGPFSFRAGNWAFYYSCTKWVGY